MTQLKLKILCITHADFETPGVIAEWAANRHFDFTIVRPYRGELIPPQNTCDILILMGGPQSPLKLAEFPYLEDEIKFTQQAIRHNKKVVGFCLGAQLIGEALGAKTERSPEKEVGVYPVTLTEEAAVDPLLMNYPKTIPVIHWHNDMPGLTKDAVVLAKSQGCPRQMIRYQPSVYGFQCHLEITHDGIKTMIEAVPEDLHPSLYTQTTAQLLEEHDYAAINAMMIDLLDRVVLLPSLEEA